MFERAWRSRRVETISTAVLASDAPDVDPCLILIPACFPFNFNLPCRSLSRTFAQPAWIMQKDHESSDSAYSSAFFLRVDRPTTETPTPSGQPKPVQLAPQQSLDPQAYYAWFYDGSPLTTILGAIAMVVVMLAAVMFPLWPVKLRLGVWYLSILALGLLGALLVLAVVRLVIWCVTVVAAKRAIWIFPNLFEDVGFVSAQSLFLLRFGEHGVMLQPLRRGEESGRSSSGRSLAVGRIQVSCG